jgi:hypothetical protein
MKTFYTLLTFCIITITTSAQQHGNRSQCYNTPWPVDMANNNRSNSVTNCGFPQGFDSSQIAYSNVQLPFPVFSYTRDTNEVFVIGGCPLIIYNYGGAIENNTPTAPSATYSAQFSPYIAKVNPYTLSTSTLNISGGTAAPYIGGAVVHANGFIYVVAAGKLFKIQATPFSIVSSVNLPVTGASFANFFNGLSVSKTGRIVAKTYNLTSGQGYLILIDENTMAIKFQLLLQMSSPRLTIDNVNNKEYIYHLNQSETYRIEIIGDSLAKDLNWTAAYDPYNNNSTDEPTSPVIAKNKVFYTTNTLYSVTTAMKIFWQNKNQNYNSTIDTLSGYYIHSDSVSAGWSFFHLSIDDSISDIIIGNDQGKGKIVAGKINALGAYQILWEKNIKTSARPAIVADRNLLYVSDYKNGFDYLVVLNLQTGQELGRKKTMATKPTIGTIILTPKDYVIYSSNEYGSSQGFINIFKSVQLTTSLAESDGRNGFTIFPNPLNDKLFIRHTNNPLKYTIKIYDMQGKSVIELENLTENEIDVSTLSAGIYMLQIKTHNEVITKKIIIE